MLGSTFIFGKRKNDVDYHIKSLTKFPAKLIALAMLLTLLVVLWMGVNSFYIHYYLTHTVAEDHKLAELGDDILYLDSVLYDLAITQSSTGDKDFDRRYKEAIENDLKTKIGNLTNEKLKESASKVDAELDVLVKLMQQHTELVSKGKFVESERILHSEEYSKSNREHLDGRRKISAIIRDASNQNILSLENNIYITMALVSGLVLIICIAWYFAFDSVSKWRITLRNTNEDLSKRIEEKEIMERKLNEYVDNLVTAKSDAEIAKKNLFDEKTRLQTIMDSMLEGIITIDEKGLIQSINSGAEKMFGYSNDEIAGENIKILMPEPDKSAHDDYLGNYKETKESRIIASARELSAIRKNGQRFPMFLSVKNMTIDGKLFFIGLTRDITVQKEKEHELEVAIYMSEAASNLKSEFLANMSHELRTPMHSVISFSRQGMERINKWSLDEHKENLSLINQSGERLLILLNDLLDLSKLEAGAVDYDMNKHSLEEIVSAVLRQINSLVEDKNLNVVMNVDASMPFVECDSPKITQIMFNLLSNAIKFSEINKTIKININSSKNENGFAIIEVEDEGVGIPDNELEEVFDKFVQSSKTKTGAGGTGLGLAICKEIALGHHGKIWADNIASGGARFSILLPIIQPDKTNEPESQNG